MATTKNIDVTLLRIISEQSLRDSYWHYKSIIPLEKRISEAFAVAAMIVLAIDILDTFIGQGGYGFLQLTNQQRGLLIVIPSMILFVSFGIGYSQNSRFTTSLLIVGGIVE